MASEHTKGPEDGRMGWTTEQDDVYDDGVDDDYYEEDEIEDEEFSEEIMSELQAENCLLRQENEALRAELRELKQLEKQFETLKTSRSGTSATKDLGSFPVSDTEVGGDLGNVVSKVSSETGDSEAFDEAEEGKLEERERDSEEGKQISATGGGEQVSCSGSSMDFGHTLSADAIRRYSRQLLVPSFGIAGQERLLKASALVVGCGGLGSPIALYLAAAGVGCLGLVDHDVVELSNLHRQVIHTEASVGMPKVKSAATACRGLNSSVQIVEYAHKLDATNAVDIVSKFDVVLDATDNLPTRYLLNDACVATGKPLVSGAAIGVEGQITVYNHGSGPCFRCLFPVPPPQGARQRCSDNGVIGVVPGIIGSFQALEAVKLAGEVGDTLSGRMLILDAFSMRIHVVKLRGRNLACTACGDSPQISHSNLHQYDYERFTQSTLSDEAPEAQHIIPDGERISNEELKRHLESGQPHVLLDVRDAHEYAISRLPNSLNIPLSSLKQKLQVLETALEDSRQMHTSVSSYRSPTIYVVCRRGNDSQRAVQLLREEGFSTAVDVIGGLESWVKNVNTEFPFY